MKNAQKIIKATGVKLILILLFGLFTSLVLYQYNEDYPVEVPPMEDSWIDIYFNESDRDENEPILEDWMLADPPSIHSL